jgi:lipid-binding SYLF domain-containing protein
LRSGGRTVDYYKTTTGSLGLQLGAQSKAVVLGFMTDAAYQQFRNSSGWTAGADAGVALAKVGANGRVDTSTATAPVVGFVLTNTGLMFNLSLEGTKVSKLET